jgi:hypothetical protein
VVVFFDGKNQSKKWRDSLQNPQYLPKLDKRIRETTMNTAAANMCLPLDYVLVAVDGTGSKDWMNADGSNSHVYQFFKRFQGGAENKKYYHGPGSTGLNTKSIARHAMAELLATLHRKSKVAGGPQLHVAKGGYQSLPLSASGNVRVCLAGHSRGGHITVWIANELSRHGIPVYFMGLYDAVDRTAGFDPFHPPEGASFAMGIDSESLSNCFNTYHALRDPQMKSRSSFGNTARKPLDQAHVYEEKLFQTSHGGIGGDPAPTATVTYGKYGQPIKYYGVTADMTSGSWGMPGHWVSQLPEPGKKSDYFELCCQFSCQVLRCISRMSDSSLTMLFQARMNTSRDWLETCSQVSIIAVAFIMFRSISSKAMIWGFLRMVR